MNKVLYIFRCIEINNHLDSIHVETSTRQISGYENIIFSFFEPIDCIFSLLLCLSSVVDTAGVLNKNNFIQKYISYPITPHFSMILESFSTAFFSFAKTMMGGLYPFRIVWSLVFFDPSDINSTIYSISFLPPPGSPMLMKQKALRYFLASCSSFYGIVALNRWVTLNTFSPALDSYSWREAI